MGAQRVSNVGNATADTDAATLGQVKGLVLGSNFLDNSSAMITARGTNSTTAGGSYFCDRWYGHRGGATGYTIATAGAGMPRQFIMQRDAANANTTTLVMGQAVGGAQANALQNVLIRGTPQYYIVVSCWVKKGANFSGSGATIEFVTNTLSATQNICTGANWTADATQTIAAAYIPSTAWYRFSCSTTTVSAGNNAGVRIKFNAPSGVAGADDSLSVIGVQVEVNTTGQPSGYNIKPYTDELHNCKRWYQSFGGASGAVQTAGYGAAGANDDRTFYFPMEFAQTPVAAVGGTWGVTNCGQPTIPQVTTKGFTLRTVVTALGSFACATNSADDVLTFDAENP